MTPSSAPPRRFAHLWFDRLSTDRMRPLLPAAAVQVQVETRRNALRLSAVDEAATAQGLSVGMTLADARARDPHITVAPSDGAADLVLLTRLGEACRRFTPAFALHAPDGLDLDVTGCLALFEGEEIRLVQALRARIEGLGLSLRLAVADTPGLAYAVARFGPGGVVAPGVREAALAPLAVAALRLDADGCAVLHRLGFRRVDQLLDVPRAALVRRLGEAILHRLDEALGRRSSPLALRLERTPFLAERRLFEPICEADQVLEVVGDLARELEVQLQTRAVGGRGFILELFRVDGVVKRLETAASRPLRAPASIAALFGERLAGLNEGLQADFGFDQLRLYAHPVQPLAASAVDLLVIEDASGDLADLADRLAARSGVAVRRLAPSNVHRPERADAVLALDRAADWAAEAAPRYADTPLRPLRLFRPPQLIEVAAAELPEGSPARFTWRRVSRTIVRAEGPERLEPEWALDPPDATERDYYRLEDETGRRYWVFRRGRYGRPPPSTPCAAHPPPGALAAGPSWYVHGLFG